MKDEIKNGMIGVEEIWNGGWENKTKKKTKLASWKFPKIKGENCALNEKKN